MGTRGPAPEPTALKIIKGNPGKRALNKLEPKPRAKKPICPDHLDEVAQREWKRLVPILLRMKVLTEADYIALANLCQTYSTMVKAQEQLNKAGILFKTPSGYIQQSPLISVVNGCIEKLNALCREFGLTPSSRTRIQTVSDGGSGKADDPWSRFG